MMGARVSSVDGRAPLTIHGRDLLTAIDYELLIASAQVKSCILLAGLNARGKTTVIENEVTRDHTERMLAWFGVPLETGRADGESARFAAVTGPANLPARDVLIPGDISSARTSSPRRRCFRVRRWRLTTLASIQPGFRFLKQLRCIRHPIEVANDRAKRATSRVGTFRFAAFDRTRFQNEL